MAKSMHKSGKKKYFRTSHYRVTTLTVQVANYLSGTIQGALPSLSTLDGTLRVVRSLFGDCVKKP